ncbi:hypothetical protein SAMN02949497_2078 [Methylomagnum ishizawai]|uniref:Small metal-binding protein n=1 Tax=Methylomagnum ishizawai TaxID=1760988 RepID=A0A1Y6D461_9GAMM|nr:hypothetical protein [Methylomagnum ishizawai]SMF94745.1 hypothetical protein SAMN02949497_2078 [Methylomagnum ishizawai]
MKTHSLIIPALVLTLGSSHCLAEQPNMQNALDYLKQAKDSLQRASQDKGGHRGSAIQAINQAIQEVKAGMEYDREHQSKEEKNKK